MPFSWDNMPYTNFHELNLDYFINKFNEIFDEWANLYDTLTTWKNTTTTELETWKTQTENNITTWENSVISDLNAWKSTTQTDISSWETATLAALDAWKTATTAIFEAIRTEAAASATAAANSATAAGNARTAAEAAQTAAEAAAASVSASILQITENANRITTLENIDEYGFKPDPRIVFQAGINRYPHADTRALRRLENANRGSSIPFTFESPYIRIIPAPDTTIGIQVLVNGLWYSGSEQGIPAVSADSIRDISIADAVSLQILKNSAVSSNDFPEIYSQWHDFQVSEKLSTPRTLTSADFINGAYANGRVCNPNANYISTPRLIYVRPGDIIAYKSPTYRIRVSAFGLNSEIYTDGGEWEDPSNEIKIYQASSEGEAIVSLNGTNILPENYDAEVTIYNHTNSRMIKLQEQVSEQSPLIRATFNNSDAIKIAFLGDSITAGSGSYTLYHMYLHERFGFQCMNYGYGGCGYDRNYPSVGGLMATGESGRGYEVTNSNKITDNRLASRISSIDTTINGLVIFGGTNDWAHGDSSSYAAFQQAVEDTIDYAQTNFGRIPIIVMGPLHRGGDTTPNATTGKTLSEYNDAIKNICIKHGVKFIDLMNGSMMYPDNDTNAMQYFVREETNELDPSLLHPNHYGHMIIANILGKEIEKYFYKN